MENLVCRGIRVGRVWVRVRAAGGGRDRDRKATGSSEAGNR